MIDAGVAVFTEYLGDRFAMGRWLLADSFVADVFCAMLDVAVAQEPTETEKRLCLPFCPPKHKTARLNPASVAGDDAS
jgi:hypothetical protein